MMVVLDLVMVVVVAVVLWEHRWWSEEADLLNVFFFKGTGAFDKSPISSVII